MQMMDFNFFSNPMVLMFFIGGMGLFSIILAVWVYNDSTNLNMANASLWAVVVLFTSLLGVIIYVLSKPVNPYSIANNRINTSVNQS
ncbi:MAG: PLDc N-terminal domain-containing protein, partial [Candidatus Hodarchaeales archaeon]